MGIDPDVAVILADHDARITAQDARIAALEQGAPPEPPDPGTDPPPEGGTDMTEVTEPMRWTGAPGDQLLGLHFHDLGADTTALSIEGDGWEVGNLLLETICLGIFWADSPNGWLHDVDVYGFGRGGAGSSGQAHAVYARDGRLTRVRVHSADPSIPNDSAAFHAHQENGPVGPLLWEACENHSGQGTIIAGYVRVEDVEVAGFVQSSGKFRIGVADVDNGQILLRGLDLATLQLDGTSFGAGSVIAGHAAEVVTAGGPGLTLEQVQDRYPELDLSGLTIG